MSIENQLAVLQAKYDMLRDAARKVVADEASNHLDPDGRTGEQAAIERSAAYGFGSLSALAKLVR